MGMTLLAVLVASLGQAAAPPAAESSAWLSFRGTPEMTGRSAATLSDALVRRWTVNLGSGIEATAAIRDGIVYVPTLAGKTFALQLADGKQVWEFAGPEGNAKDLGPVKSSPALAGNRLVYGDDFGFVRALDVQTGKQAWIFETNDQVVCSPIVVDGKVLVGSYDGTLYALDLATGKQVWAKMTDGPIHTSPTLIGGDQVSVSGCDGFFRLLKVADGSEAAALELGGNIASTGALVGDYLYLGLLGEPVVALDWKKPEIRWTFQPRRPLGFYSSPAVTNDLVIIGGRDKQVYGLDAKSGDKKWSFAAQGKVDASPVIVGTRAFVGSVDGNLYALQVADGAKVWEFAVGSPIVASAAVADGRLVIGDQDGNLHCFGGE